MKNFTEAQKAEMVTRYQNGEPVRNIAASFQSAQETIYKILRKESVVDAKRSMKAYWKNNPEKAAAHKAAIHKGVIDYFENRGYIQFEHMGTSQKADIVNLSHSVFTSNIIRDRSGISRNTCNRIYKEAGVPRPYYDSTYKHETSLNRPSDTQKAQVLALREKGMSYKEIFHYTNVKECTAKSVIKKCNTDPAYKSYLESIIKKS